MDTGLLPLSSVCLPNSPPPGAQWLVLPRPAEKEGPGLAGWGEIELASEFWTEDKRLKGLVSASLSAQSEDSKVGGVS